MAGRTRESLTAELNALEPGKHTPIGRRDFGSTGFQDFMATINGAVADTIDGRDGFESILRESAEGQELLIRKRPNHEFAGRILAEAPKTAPVLDLLNLNTSAIDVYESKVKDALAAYGRGVLTDEQVVLLDESHRLFVALYRAFDPSPNLRLNQEQFTRLRERRKL